MKFNECVKLKSCDNIITGMHLRVPNRTPSGAETAARVVYVIKSEQLFPLHERGAEGVIKLDLIESRGPRGALHKISEAQSGAHVSLFDSVCQNTTKHSTCMHAARRGGWKTL
jgi:hypothetical protein